MAFTALCLMMCECVAFPLVLKWKDFYCDTGPCGPGEYLVKDAPDCLPCPEGFFMPFTQHGCFSCKRCSAANYYNHEVLKQTCTSTSDTEIGCKSGYYRFPFDSFWMVDNDCNRCTRCGHRQIERELCSEYRDTVCQPKPVKRSNPETNSVDVDEVKLVEYVKFRAEKFGILLYS